MNPRTYFPKLAAALLLSAGAVCHAQDPMLVVGHMNPDTDSICSAIGVASLKIAQGIPAQAVRQGPVPAEAKLVLEQFRLPEPPLTTSVAGQRVYLVDHTEAAQAPKDLKQAELVGFVDHHKLGGLTTDKPYEGLAAPVGATGTLIVRLYDQAQQPVPAGVAGCLLAAILTDTVMFKSATATDEDRETARRLARIAGVDDLDAFGRSLQEAKSDLRGQPPMSLLKRDFKDFAMNGRKVGVGQLELLDLSAVATMKPDLLAAMQTVKQEGYHSVFLMLTDTTHEATELLYLSDDPQIVEKAWRVRAQGQSAWLPGVMSRKSQVVPALQKAFE